MDGEEWTGSTMEYLSPLRPQLVRCDRPKYSIGITVPSIHQSINIQKIQIHSYIHDIMQIVLCCFYSLALLATTSHSFVLLASLHSKSYHHPHPHHRGSRLRSHQPKPSLGSLQYNVTTTLQQHKQQHKQDTLLMLKDQSTASRRDFVCGATTATAAIAAGVSLGGLGWNPQSAVADTTTTDVYKPAVRPLAYRVDSTIPPTLLSITPRQGEGILSAIGRGSGTDKEAILVDSINFNNMLNKAVFGAINSVTSFTGSENTRAKSWQASFCCLALPTATQPEDVALAQQLLQTLQGNARKSAQRTGLGLFFCPYSTQPVLNQYTRGEIDEMTLEQALEQAGVSLTTQQLYAPILQYAKSTNALDLIAMAPEVQDMVTVRSRGLQNVNPDRRAQYVRDASGFIALSQDPRFKLYTDRSLAKDFPPSSSSNNNNSKGNDKDSFANFFSERIMAHEAGATALAQYAVGLDANAEPRGSYSASSSFVTVLAPIADLRYLGGINGRLPRICRALKPDSGVTDNAVTTILLNPTAVDTLSKTRHLRLEIGTSPDNLDYQTKVADYLWFSTSPKVNLIPRLMN